MPENRINIRSTKCSLPVYQRGQAAVYVLLFVPALIFILYTLFNVGQLTREKMEVQNAADAAAYSVATLTARQMNFSAYLNRAMIANEISLGQLSAFAAWRYKFANWKTEPSWITFEAALQGMAAGMDFVLPGSGSVVRGFLTVLKGVMTAVDKSYQAIGGMMQMLDAVFGTLAQIYNGYGSIAQIIMRMATYEATLVSTPVVVADNAKNAQLSNFGMIAMLLSISEQQYKFSRVNTGPGPFASVFGYNDKDKRAMRRFSAIVNRDVDDGARGSSNCNTSYNKNWIRNRCRDDLGLDFSIFGFGITTRGGTERRIDNKSGKEYYNWSSIDTGTFNMWFDVGAASESFDVATGGATSQLKHKNANAYAKSQFKWRIDDQNYYGSTWADHRLSAVAAVTRGGQTSKNYNGLLAYTGIDPDNYASVNDGPLFLMGVKKQKGFIRTSDNLADMAGGRYETLKTTTTGKGIEGDLAGQINDLLGGGLRMNFNLEIEGYTINGFNFLGYSLGSVTTPGISIPINYSADTSAIADAIDTSTIDNALEAVGVSQGEAIFALGGSQVYYTRPDGADENGNMFNPYWQPRLKQVPDNIRKWALFTQDGSLHDLLQDKIDEKILDAQNRANEYLNETIAGVLP